MHKIHTFLKCAALWVTQPAQLKITNKPTFIHPLSHCAHLYEVVFAAVILHWATCRVLKIDFLAEI